MLRIKIYTKRNYINTFLKLATTDLKVEPIKASTIIRTINQIILRKNSKNFI
jgi:hypothetical protein